jgi:hypothetical protein
MHASCLELSACRTFCVVLVSAQETATTKSFLAGPFTGVDELDTASFALHRVGVFENRTPAHAGSSLSGTQTVSLSDQPARSMSPHVSALHRVMRSAPALKWVGLLLLVTGPCRFCISR